MKTAVLASLTISLLLCALPALAVVNTTGTITLENSNGEVTAGIDPGTTISVTFTEQSTSSSSGGGGGGGAIGESDPCLAAIPTTSHAYDRVVAGRSYHLSSPNNQFLFKNVRFTVTADHENVIFTLSHIENIVCESVPELSSEFQALGYERLDYVGILPGEITNVTITFQLPTSLLGDADPSSVTLYRYHAGNWNALPTALTDRQSLLYTATSPGLSVFAVAVPVLESQAGSSNPSNPSANSSSSVVTGEVTRDDRYDREFYPIDELSDEKGLFHNFPLTSLLIVLILGGILGGYYVVSNQRKVAAVNAAAAIQEEERRPLIGVPEIPDEALQDPVEQLRAYVDKELRRGFSRPLIAAQLRKSGWPENIITDVLDRFGQAYLASHGVEAPHDDYEKLQSFIAAHLAQGYSVQALTQSLVAAGWDATLVASLVKDLQQERAAATTQYSAEALAKLRAFIKEELAAGHPREAVKASLLAAGWQERVVEEELSRSS